MKPLSILGMTLIFGLSTASIACTKTEEVSAADDAGAEPEPTEDAGTAEDVEGGGDKPASTPKEECERYLACVNEAAPENGGTAVALYGDDAPCWKGSAADAKSCGDACRLARVVVPKNGKENPHCGCAADSECKGFCSKTQACTGVAWAGLIDACEDYAADAKKALTAWKKAQGGALPCAALANANCEAIRGLAFRASYAEDSQERMIDPDDLREYYELPRSGAEAWDAIGFQSSYDGAPSSCAEAMLFGLAAARTMWQSPDLVVYVKP